MKEYLWFISISLLLFLYPIRDAAFAEVLIDQTIGQMQQNAIVTVNGSGFGQKRTPTDYDYFDYTSDWHCNSTSGACTNPPPGEDFNWVKMIINGDSCMMNYGNPLHNIASWSTNFSTGRAFNQWIEGSAEGCSGGQPNGSMEYDHPDTSEIFYVYHYQLLNWNYPHDAGPQEKQVEFWEVDGTKTTVYLNNRTNPPGGGNTFEFSEEGNLGPMASSCPSCLGYEAPDYRSNEVVYNELPGYANIGHNNWYQIKIHSKKAGSNGVVELWIDGIKIIDDFSVSMTSSQYSKIRIVSNWSSPNTLPIPSGQERLRSVDDVLINYSSTDPTGGIFPGIGIVYLSNQSTWGNGPQDNSRCLGKNNPWSFCTRSGYGTKTGSGLLNGDSNFVRQVVGGTDPANLGFKSWTDTQFKFQVNLGSLDTSKPIYLYVTNWNGETNSTGLHLTAGLPPAAPANFAIIQQ